MRARPPDREGHVESHGTRIFWEEHGHGPRAVLFLPPWQIVHSRVWKMQAEADPETLAHAEAEGLKRPVAYRDVETDGARRAAALIAPLLTGERR
jgi:hypothetical protein